MFSFRVLIDLRFIKMLLKHPEVNDNDSTWVRLKFFLYKKKREMVAHLILIKKLTRGKINSSLTSKNAICFFFFNEERGFKIRT